MKKRAGFYIDGFNFYHAVDDLGANYLKWLSYRRLCQRLISNDEEVECIKVFTALAKHKSDSARRHELYNRFLRAEDVKVVLGEFKRVHEWCLNCGDEWIGHVEKESDVNLAVHLIGDLCRGLVDVAYVFTTDTDQVASLKLARAMFSSAEIIVVAPPGRSHSQKLTSFAHRTISLRVSDLEESLLPESILIGGKVLVRPFAYGP